TYNKANTSTILTFNGTNGRFWNLELDDGELKLNQNSVRYAIRLPNSVNLADGTYHTIYLEREGNLYRVFINGTFLTRFTTSGQGFPYSQLIFGADPRGRNVFYGTVGNLKWNGVVYDRSKFPDGGRRPTYDHVIPLPLPANLAEPPSCSDKAWRGYCSNNGRCYESGMSLKCECLPPYYGQRCTKTPYGVRIQREDNRDECAVLRVSSVPTGSDGSTRTESFRFGFQTFQSTAVLVTVYNRQEQFWQLFLRDGRVYLRDSFSRDARMVFYPRVNDGAAHTIVGNRDGQSLSFFLDGEGGMVDRYALNRSLFGSDGQFEHSKLEFGAGNYSDGPGRPDYKLCFLGAIGGKS
uniref:EGF-like domain-containing protein n=1 Tax=Macrostomum lignano TaxID=282301 RepID=A0A1I8IU57_9PLAT